MIVFKFFCYLVIEYSSLRKIGINEPDSYIKSSLNNQNIMFFPSSCFADYFLEHIQQDIEENLNRNGFSDISVFFEIYAKLILIYKSF